MKICVLIPAYNEAEHLDTLLAEVTPFVQDVIVVDDGSEDGSSQVASARGARVVRHEQNLGKGAALRTGFDYVLKGDWDAVITMDGDGQHDPRDVPGFLAMAGNADVVIGNRMTDPRNMPLVRLLTNKGMSLLISLLTRQKIPDTQCGFRLMTRKVLKNLVFATSNFESESEILIAACKDKYTVVSVPIQTIYRQEKSKIRPVRDAVRFLKLILKGPHGRTKKR
jgi:glycosyltransferase involved in cell wall biosynthesis